MNNIPSILKQWAHNTSANYNRSAAADSSETLFFGSAVRVVNSNADFSFKMSDLQTTYKITANYYGPNGISVAQKRIQTGGTFGMNYTLPSVMSIGDVYNVTANIINFSPTNLIATPVVVNNDRSI